MRLPTSAILLSLILLSVVSNCRSVKHQLQFTGHRHMSSQIHSSHALRFWNHQMHNLHGMKVKHDMAALESDLKTDGFSFRMPMKIDGISYNLNLDTGSSDFMIKGQNTSGIPENKYKCDQHNCQILQNQIWVGYMDGFLNCYATQQNIQFANHNFDAQIVVAYQAQKKFDTVQGICGVSFPQLAQHQPTLLQSMKTQGLIDKYAYGVNFNFIHTQKSAMTFGESDSNYYDGNLDLYQIIRGYAFRTKFNYIKFGEGKKIKLRTSLLDTGTTCIAVPGKYSDDILEQFQNQDTVNRCYYYPQVLQGYKILICRILDFEQLPTIQVVIDEIIYKIEKQVYVQYCLEHNNMQYCVTYIQIMEYARDGIILGAGFFRRYYGYFDIDNRQVGLAKNKQNLTIEDILNQPPQDVYLEQDWAPVNY